MRLVLSDSPPAGSRLGFLVGPTHEGANLHADDMDWLTMMRNGHPDAIAACYRRHAPALLSLALRLTGERADAEDVVQEVFIGLPEALGRYAERGAFEGWLRRLTVRHAMMRIRQKRNRGEIDDSEHALSLLHVKEHALTDTVLVERALRALSEATRQVVVLRVLEGHSHQEIASLLGISIAASEARFSRAMKTLRGLLGDIL